MSIDTEVGLRVHEAMFRRRVSQTALAPRMGISQSVLSRKLRGTVPWSLDDLWTAASALGIEAADLFPRSVDLPSPDPEVNSGCRLSEVGTVIPFPLVRHGDRTHRAA